MWKNVKGRIISNSRNAFLSMRLPFSRLRSALYVYLITSLFLYINISFFLSLSRVGINKYISFISQGQKEIVAVSGVRSKSCASLPSGALVKGFFFFFFFLSFLVGYTIYVKSRFILDLTRMIEVSSKFVRCLARISQPRSDLNPERGSIFNGTRRKTPRYTPDKCQARRYYTIINSLTAELHFRRPKFTFEQKFATKITLKETFSENEKSAPGIFE